MSNTPPQLATEAILRDAGIEPEQRLNNGNTTFSYLEACIMGALDEIEDECGDGNGWTRLQCARCGEQIEDREDEVSTPSGSMHCQCAHDYENEAPEDW
jgi:hypothetical protein